MEYCYGQSSFSRLILFRQSWQPFIVLHTKRVPIKKFLRLKWCCPSSFDWWHFNVQHKSKQNQSLEIAIDRESIYHSTPGTELGKRILVMRTVRIVQEIGKRFLFFSWSWSIVFYNSKELIKREKQRKWMVKLVIEYWTFFRLCTCLLPYRFAPKSDEGKKNNCMAQEIKTIPNVLFSEIMYAFIDCLHYHQSEMNDFKVTRLKQTQSYCLFDQKKKCIDELNWNH